MKSKAKTRTIAITSGKGGVGKTTLSVNLAMALAEKGFRTCLLDADLGLANVNLLLGLDVAKTLEDVLFENIPLQDVMHRDVHGIDIIPGSSGIQRMADLDPGRVHGLLESFGGLRDYDFFLMDTSAGIARNVVAFCLAAQEVVLVVTPEPASMTDAYALLKVLQLNGFPGIVRVVVSRCKDIASAKVFFDRFQKTASDYLSMKVLLLGVVVLDRNVQDSVQRRTPLLAIHPRANAGRCIRHIAKSLAARSPAALDSGLSPFWERFMRLVRAPMDFGDGASDSKSGAPETTETGDDDNPGRIVPELADCVTELTQELRLLREAVEGMAVLGSGPSSKAGSAASEGGPIIPLDFDAFAAHYRSSGKRGT